MDVPIPEPSSIESKTNLVFYKPGRERKRCHWFIDYLQNIPWESPITGRHCLHLELREDIHQQQTTEKSLYIP